MRASGMDVKAFLGKQWFTVGVSAAVGFAARDAAFVFPFSPLFSLVVR